MQKVNLNNNKYNTLTFIPLIKATNDKIIDYTNIDYSSMKFYVLDEKLNDYKENRISLLHNSNEFISELYCDEFNVRMINEFIKIYVIEAKSTEGDDIIVIASPSHQVTKYLHAIQFLNHKGELYYKPFEHVMKLMEICIYNLDELPKDKLKMLKEKYHTDIKIKYSTYNEASLNKDIVSNTSTIFSQNKDNLNNFDFINFEYNKIIKIIIDSYHESLFLNISGSENETVTRYGYTNHNITSKIFSLDEFKKLHYGQGTLSDLSFYYIKPVYNEKYWTNIINDIPVNRVKSLLLTGTNNVKFYDWTDSQFMYTFRTNKFGNIFINNKSMNKYLISDLLNVIEF